MRIAVAQLNAGCFPMVDIPVLMGSTNVHLITDSLALDPANKLLVCLFFLTLFTSVLFS
jgi:hypothetical protein